MGTAFEVTHVCIQKQLLKFQFFKCRYSSGVCPEVVANGFRCIFSNQGAWYLNWVNTPWEDFYTSEPWEGIDDPAQQQLVIGGEVCMWDEFGDTSDLQQTIWPRAAAAAGMYIFDNRILF